MATAATSSSKKKITAATGRQEAAILIKCQCDHVVQLLACFTTSGATYLFMSFYSLKDLALWLRRDKTRQVFDEKMATWLLSHLLMAVSYIHSISYLHLDVKPSNIFINNNGYPLLADFGGAAEITCSLSPAARATPRATPHQRLSWIPP